jgi:hypothetical protein
VWSAPSFRTKEPISQCRLQFGRADGDCLDRILVFRVRNVVGRVVAALLRHVVRPPSVARIRHRVKKRHVQAPPHVGNAYIEGQAPQKKSSRF